MNNIRPLTEESRAVEVAYGNCLYALKRNIRKYFDKPDSCEDCEQETLLWAARYIDSFMASENREGWLIKASSNVAMKLIDSEKRYKHTAVVLNSVITETDTDDFEIDDPHGRIAVITEVEKHLSKKNAELFHLIMIEHKTDEELSDYYGISESAVRGKRKRLADNIGSLPDEIKNKLTFL